MKTQAKASGQQKRFEVYLDRLAEASGHLDRAGPLKNYCKGLLLAGERKSVEPMAAGLAPANVRRMQRRPMGPAGAAIDKPMGRPRKKKLT